MKRKKQKPPPANLGGEQKDPPVDPERSALMAKVKGRDTKPEIRVRKFLHAAGLRFRLHRSGLPGRPDLVFPSKRIAVFVHGCFWHRHPGCKATRMPKTRRAFWEDKFQKNVERDERNQSELESMGWTVIVIWECETKDQERLQALASQIIEAPVQ